MRAMRPEVLTALGSNAIYKVSVVSLLVSCICKDKLSSYFGFTPSITCICSCISSKPVTCLRPHSYTNNFAWETALGTTYTPGPVTELASLPATSLLVEQICLILNLDPPPTLSFLLFGSTFFLLAWYLFSLGGVFRYVTYKN